MTILTPEYIRKQIAMSDAIYERGHKLYQHGAFALIDGGPSEGRFEYQVDGRYGDYTTTITITPKKVFTNCDCPYPLDGCKHAVAVAFDARDQLMGWKMAVPVASDVEADDQDAEASGKLRFLSPDEIREQVLEDRANRAKNEELRLIPGDMAKGDHVVQTRSGRHYDVTFHDPMAGKGHCSCPDYLTNRLGVCKHMIFAHEALKKEKSLKERAAGERFPFADIFIDSETGMPRLFVERPEIIDSEAGRLLREYFDEAGRFLHADPAELLPLLDRLGDVKSVYVREPVIHLVDERLLDRQLEELSRREPPPIQGLTTPLYPYQETGVRFGLFRKGVLIGDEMGLGKTLQAIALGLMKREIFGFERILVVTLASLKEQWKREIERFTEASAVVVAGPPDQRERQYLEETALFRITNYEAVLRDGMVLDRFRPDMVILDEAQRIKNFATKTADAVKRIPRKHSLVLTGTPLENRLADVYSIVQFLDPERLSPLWRFAADHFMLSRDQKGREKNMKTLGYRNLDLLREKIAPIVIRRRKEEVLKDLPETLTNTYFIDLSEQQAKMHQSYAMKPHAVAQQEVPDADGHATDSGASAQDAPVVRFDLPDRPEDPDILQNG